MTARQSPDLTHSDCPDCVHGLYQHGPRGCLQCRRGLLPNEPNPCPLTPDEVAARIETHHTTQAVTP